MGSVKKERVAASTFKRRAPHRSSCSRHAQRRRPSTEIRLDLNSAPQTYEPLLLACFVARAWRANGRDSPRTHRMHRYKPHSPLTRGAFSDEGTERRQDDSLCRSIRLLPALPMVVRTYAPVGKTPVLRENLSRDHLSAMSVITLEGKLYMTEQERAFKGEEAVRFLKHLLHHIPGKLLVVWDGSPIHRGGRSKISLPAGQLLGCNWNNCPATHQISTLMRGSGSTSNVWS
jgi:hypothetical protein